MAAEGAGEAVTFPLIGIALFFAGGVAACSVRSRARGPAFAAFALLAQGFLLPGAVNVLLGGIPKVLTLHMSGPIGDASLRLDPLSSFFILLISLGGVFAAFYSIGYMKIYKEEDGYSLSRYYGFLGLLVSAMLMVAIVQNMILFLMVWEIMSMASFFLVGFEDRKEEVRKAAMYYLVAMHIGAAFLMAAFSWSYALTGSLDFAALKAIPGAHPAAAAGLFILLFIGFGTKAGFVPFHTWLPLAHPAAPTGVSAVMSGVMIKTGIYGILRLILLMGVPHPALAYGVFGIALLSGVLGVMNAIAQHDLKKLLAYHSIENIGIIGMGIGLGMIGLVTRHDGIAMAGFLGALLHTFNHFTFKSLLFYGAGAVYARTHTRDIEKLGGLAHILPTTAALFLIGSLAICGLPLLNGFISEFAIFMGLARGLTLHTTTLVLASIAGLSGLAFIGAMALLCFTKVYGICFSGSPRSDGLDTPAGESAAMLAPMIALAALIFLIGLGIPWLLPLLSPVVQQFLPAPATSEWGTQAGLFSTLSLALLVFGGLLLIFAALRWLLGWGKASARFKTWDCGYQAASPRLQYTGSSFASPFLALVTGWVPRKKRIVPPQGLFPKEAALETHAVDVLDFFMIRPAVFLLGQFLGLFTWVQSGRTQQYILYGLAALVLLLAWIIGVR